MANVISHSMSIVYAKEEEPASSISDDSALEPLLCTALIERYEGGTNESFQPEGYGTAYFKGGHKYVGEFHKGMMHGKGSYEWTDGIKYEGSFSENVVDGYGTYYWPQEMATYTGEVVNGRKQGYGTLSFENTQAVYEGMWQDGYRHGEGKLSFDAEGKTYYQGAWLKGRREGIGRLQYASGNYYEGNWKGDLKTGTGTMHWVVTNEMYEGRWELGLPDGWGEHTWLGGAYAHTLLAANTVGNDATQFQWCNRYKGNFRQGERQGKGSFFYATGARYEGNWERNVKSGEGAFTFEDGSVYEGNFLDDRPAKMGSVVKTNRVSYTPLPKDLDSNLYSDNKSSLPSMNESIPPPHVPVKIEILDLLAEELIPEDTMLTVSNLLLRYNTEFKQIYRHYATLQTPTSDQSSKSFMLTMHQFWRFIKDCNLTSKDFSLSRITMLTVKALREQEGKEEGPFNPASHVLFREFVESLVRIAHYMYHDLPALERRVHHIINLNILPYACKVEADLFRLEMDSEAMAAMLRKHTKALFRIFNHTAQTVKSPTTAHNDTVTVRDFIQLLDSTLIIGPYLSRRACLSIFCRSNFPDDQFWKETKMAALAAEQEAREVKEAQEAMEAMMESTREPSAPPSVTHSDQDDKDDKDLLDEENIPSNEDEPKPEEPALENDESPEVAEVEITPEVEIEVEQEEEEEEKEEEAETEYEEEEEDDDYFSLESELLFPEFMELLARCAARYYEREGKYEERFTPASQAEQLEDFLLDLLFPGAYRLDIGLSEEYARRAQVEDVEEDEREDGDSEEEDFEDGREE